MMKKNIGSADRIIRLLAALVIAILYLSGAVSGVIGIILLIAGGILLATGLVQFCGLYAILGIKTCPNKAKN